MKLHSNSHIRVLAIAGLTVFTASQAWAVIPFSWVTNGSGTVTNGSWMGNGTVQNNLNPASTTAQIAVQDFSSGTIGINNMGGSAAGNIFAQNRILTNPISAMHTISLTGGTADLRLHNSTNNDGGGALFNSVGLTGFSAGVTSVSWTVRFSEPIAGRNETLTSLSTRPMGAGLALLNAGGHAVSDFTVGMNYSEIYSYNSGSGVFEEGVAAGAVPLQNPGFGTSVAGATSFNSLAFNGFNTFLLVRGYNQPGGGAAYSAADAPLVYMREMTWTITPDAGKSFNAGTIFVTSMDGQQYSNVIDVIPEPTSYLLVAGSVVGGCFLRRRRA